jgi:hypothetical protein
MISVRRGEREDWEDIVRLAKEQDFPFPDLSFLQSLWVVVKDGKVIAFGYVRLLAEAVFAPSKKSKKDIGAALKLIHEKMLEDVKVLNFKQIHVFSMPHDYGDILIKHFGFEDVVGRSQVLNIPEDSDG